MSVDFGMAYLDGKGSGRERRLRNQMMRTALEGHLSRQRPAGFRPVQHEILIFMYHQERPRALFLSISPTERTAVVNNCTFFFYRCYGDFFQHLIPFCRTFPSPVALLVIPYKNPGPNRITE